LPRSLGTRLLTATRGWDRLMRALRGVAHKRWLKADVGSAGVRWSWDAHIADGQPRPPEKRPLLLSSLCFLVGRCQALALEALLFPGPWFPGVVVVFSVADSALPPKSHIGPCVCFKRSPGDEKQVCRQATAFLIKHSLLRVPACLVWHLNKKQTTSDCHRTTTGNRRLQLTIVSPSCTGGAEEDRTCGCPHDTYPDPTHA
jgi:hypothetical protein